MNKMVNQPEAVAPVKPVSDDLLKRFAEIIGERYVVTDPNDVAPYLVEERNLYQGHSRVVLRPGSTAEVAAICKLATETHTALVPQGGNTGLVGGQTPHHGEVVLSLRRLDRIREIDPQSNTMTVEAGVVLKTAQDKAADADRLFPLSLGAEGSATIGGNISTNAGGSSALAYGIMRDLVVGLEVVLADGRILNDLSKLKKDNTGYNLRNLFIGAEGTLGIVTAAVLKLFPKPSVIETAFIGLQSPEAALKLLQIAQKHAGARVTSFELMAEMAVDFTVRHIPGVRAPMSQRYPWYVLCELSGADPSLRDTLETILSEGAEAGLLDDAVMASSMDQRDAFWHLRDSLSHAQKPEGVSIKHDISVPVASVPAFIAEATAAVEKLAPGIRPCPFGHLGDGNMHYNLSQPVGADSKAFLARWHEISDVVHAIAMKMGGSISAEHGIGVMKRDELPHVKDKVAMELMRTLKATLDPAGILNPGKVV